MPVWSTRAAGDPTSVGHAMPEDFHGRPDSPVCGISTHGLYFRAWLDWSEVPEERRCGSCADALLGAARP